MELEHLGTVTDAAYSPDSKYLVACDTNRKVVLYTVPEYKVKKEVFVLYNLYKPQISLKFIHVACTKLQKRCYLFSPFNLRHLVDY